MLPRRLALHQASAEPWKKPRRLWTPCRIYHPTCPTGLNGQVGIMREDGGRWCEIGTIKSRLEAYNEDMAFASSLPEGEIT